MPRGWFPPCGTSGTAAWQARMPSPMARIVLPLPGGPVAGSGYHGAGVASSRIGRGGCWRSGRREEPPCHGLSAR
jgi:hypothetical protein